MMAVTNTRELQVHDLAHITDVSLLAPQAPHEEIWAGQMKHVPSQMTWVYETTLERGEE